MNIPDQPIAMSPQIHTYTAFWREIQDALWIHHPEWVETNAESPSVILTSRAFWKTVLTQTGDPTSLSLLFIAPSNRELEGKDLWNMF